MFLSLSCSISNYFLIIPDEPAPNQPWYQLVFLLYRWYFCHLVAFGQKTVKFKIGPQDSGFTGKRGRNFNFGFMIQIMNILALNCFFCVFCVKIRAGVLAVDDWKNLKNEQNNKIANQLIGCAKSRMRRYETLKPIWINILQDGRYLRHNNLRKFWWRSVKGLGDASPHIRLSSSSIARPTTLAIQCKSMMYKLHFLYLLIFLQTTREWCQAKWKCHGVPVL